MSSSSSRFRHGLLLVAALAVLIPALAAAWSHRAPARPATTSVATMHPPHHGPETSPSGPPLTAPDPPTRVALKAPNPVTAPDAPERLPWFGLRLITADPGLHEDLAPGPPPAVNAAGGILIDADSGRIIWQRDPHRSLPPASTTKILTAMIALENFDPQRQVTVTPDALTQQADETLMGLAPHEQLSIEELLTGALLVSGNDAATALAVDTVGMDNYVAAMNAQVAALGLHDSHFVTTVGLDDPGQRSSAFDLAVLARTAVTRFPLFQRLVAMPGAVLPATPGHPAFSLSNLNQLLTTYPGAVGVKPGWTGAAGGCLVGMAVRNGHRLISVLLNAPLPYAQTRGLLDWGFAQDGR